MGILSDSQIRELIGIEPFEENVKRPGRISYGVSSYGYDLRVGSVFKIFTNVNSEIVDPKRFSERSFVTIDTAATGRDHVLIPPNSFALCETVETVTMPREYLAVCLGKCVTGDTRVVDAETGDYLPMREFVAGRRGGAVAMDRGRLRPAKVSDHVHSGIQPVYRLVTRSGLEIKATASHPLRTIDGWTPLGDLRYGDRIAAARSCPVFGKDELPEHEALLLGFMLADGQCRTPGHSPRYTTGDPRLAEAFREAATAFGRRVTPVGPFGYNLVNHVGRGGVPQRNRAFAWLQSLDCDRGSVDKRVPSVIFRAPRPAVAAFLRALFSGDGSVYTSTSRKGTEGICLEYASSSRRLAEDVRHLLLRFGIFALLRDRVSASGRTAYRVQITDPDLVARFAREIGFVEGSRKDETLRRLLADRGERPAGRTNFDTLPVQVWGRMTQAAHSAHRSLLGLGVKGNSTQSVPYRFARAVATATADPQLQELVAADVVWDTVESITPEPAQAVYDITVSGPQNFVANDLVVHNSTYARCGIIVNVTPIEPEWRGKITLEISNTTPLPAKIYANEGIAQLLFLKGEKVCAVSYADKSGKYQDQSGLTLPKVD